MNPTGKGAVVKHKKGNRYGLVTLTGNRQRRHTTPWYEALCDCGRLLWLSLPGLSKLAGCSFCRGFRSHVRQKLSNYKLQADKRDLDFALSEQQFTELVTGSCHYCGAIAGYRGHLQDASLFLLTLNGVDRVDNSFGYLLENCVPCCSTCNRAKSVMTETEFLRWVARVYKHSCKK